MAAKKSKASGFYDAYHSHFKTAEEHPYVVGTYRLFKKWFHEIIRPKPGSRLLDLSCGQGYFLKIAVAGDPSLEVHGLDHSRVAVKISRAREPKARVKVADALHTGYPSSYFDTITCLGALEHYPDSGKGLAEIRRILKDDGRAFVYVPNLFFLGYLYLVWRTGETPHEAGQNEYEHFETRQGWEDLCRKNGLRILSVSKHNEMFATERLPALVKWIYRFFIEPWVPLNFSYCFGFLLEKDPHFKKRSTR